MVSFITIRLPRASSLQKFCKKGERMCYDMGMIETLQDNAVCTCGVSSPGVVVVLKGAIEHHCTSPAPCWVDQPLPDIEV